MARCRSIRSATGFSPPGLADLRSSSGNPPDTPETREAIAAFDPTSLCYSETKNGQAVLLTDFRQTATGLTQVLGHRSPA